MAGGGIEIPSHYLIEFNDWVNKKYPDTNIFASIPISKLNNLIAQFCTDKDYEINFGMDYYVDFFRKKLYSPFYNTSNSDKFRMMFNFIFNKKKGSG